MIDLVAILNITKTLPIHTEKVASQSTVYIGFNIPKLLVCTCIGHQIQSI